MSLSSLSPGLNRWGAPGVNPDARPTGDGLSGVCVTQPPRPSITASATVKTSGEGVRIMTVITDAARQDRRARRCPCAMPVPAAPGAAALTAWEAGRGPPAPPAVEATICPLFFSAPGRPCLSVHALCRHAGDELPRRARVDGALEADDERGACLVAPRPHAQPGAPHLHAARRHRPDQGGDERHALADADRPGEYVREAHRRRRLARRLAHDGAPQAIVGDQRGPALGPDDARAPPDGAMAMEHPRGPGEAAPELVGAHAARPPVPREAREGDASGGREPHRACEDPRVVP